MEIQPTVLDNESTHCQRRRDKMSCRTGSKAGRQWTRERFNDFLLPPPSHHQVISHHSSQLSLNPNTFSHNNTFVNPRKTINMFVLVRGRVEEGWLTLKVWRDVSKAAWVGAERHSHPVIYSDVTICCIVPNVCVCISHSWQMRLLHLRIMQTSFPQMQNDWRGRSQQGSVKFSVCSPHEAAKYKFSWEKKDVNLMIIQGEGWRNLIN